MATLTATTAAVVALLTPLAPATFARVYHGPQEQLNEFPCCEVIFGPATIARNQQQRFLERQSARTGVVRIYARRNADLPAEFAMLEPLVDAVELAFGAAPDLGIGVDRFDATGNGAPAMDQFGDTKVVFVDVSWQAIDAEAGAYVQDW